LANPAPTSKANRLWEFFMHKSLLKRTSLSLATAALAMGVATGAQAGKLSIGHTTWVGYGTLYLARDLGYFKDAGLDVELTTIEEASMYMAAQASGQLSGSASTIDEILKYRSKDFCFKAVAALDESHGGDGIVMSKDIADIKGLKGKSVAVNEGSVSQFWLSYLLKNAGMSMADVEVQNMTADDAASAFIAGRVPAAVTWEPNLTMVKQKGAGKVLVDSSSTPGVIVDVVALDCDVIEAAGRRQGAGRRPVQGGRVHQDPSQGSLRDHGQGRRRLPVETRGPGRSRQGREVLRPGDEREAARRARQVRRHRRHHQPGQRDLEQPAGQTVRREVRRPGRHLLRQTLSTPLNADGRSAAPLPGGARNSMAVDRFVP